MNDLTVTDAGRTWHKYACEFTSPDGTFGFEIYAISDEHASMQIEALKETARVAGRIVKEIEG